MTADDDANLWQSTAGPPVSAAPLAGDVKVDVAVIGGGYTGCSAALHLAREGAAVCLLEAATIGYGGSGRNAGLVNAGLWLEPDKVERALGRRDGVRLNEVLAAGPELVFSLVDKYAIACEPTRTGTLHCAHANAGLDNLRERYRQHTQRGAPVDLLDAGETAARTGTRRYIGALIDHRAGTVQPLAYVRGLARAAAEAGARLYERSAVQGMDFGDGGWTLNTAQGVVRAQAIVLATNAYHSDLPCRGEPSCTIVNYFQMATQPLAAQHLAEILPERQGAWDTAQVMSSFRLDQAGRLILGAMGSLDSAGRAIHQGWMRRKLSALFPQVAQSEFEYAWFGRIAMTADHLPKIVRFGDRSLSVFGYSGRGIGPGTVLGKAVAEYLLSGDEDHLPLTPSDHHRENMCALKQTCYEMGASLFHLLNCRR